jgi:2,4-dienoyl-CoA reductase-like NADH-dependent reductase (Old Yellow Enzyme family)
MIEVETNPLQKLAIALFGPFLVRVTPFEPMFFLPLARRVRAAVSLPLVYLGGATSLDDLARGRAEGFEMVAMGRALLRDPDLVARYARGERRTSTCEPCNRCITEMDRPGGVVCALEPRQLDRRAAAVARGLHLQVARGEAGVTESGCR